jgi:hypothetical protein
MKRLNRRQDLKASIKWIDEAIDEEYEAFKTEGMEETTFLNYVLGLEEDRKLLLRELEALD